MKIPGPFCSFFYEPVIQINAANMINSDQIQTRELCMKTLRGLLESDIRKGPYTRKQTGMSPVLQRKNFIENN